MVITSQSRLYVVQYDEHCNSECRVNMQIDDGLAPIWIRMTYENDQTWDPF